MKRSIAASERQFTEALPSSHSRADVGAHAIGSPYPHYVWEGYPKQRTASIFIVDGMNVRDSRVHNYGRGGMQRPSGASPNRRSPARDLGVHVTTQLLCIRQPATG